MNGNEKVCAALTRDLGPAREFYIVVAITNHDWRVSGHSVEIVVELACDAQSDVLLLEFAVIADAAGILAAVACRNRHHYIAALIGDFIWFSLGSRCSPSCRGIPRRNFVDGIFVIEIDHESMAKLSIRLERETFRLCFSVQVDDYSKQPSVACRTA